MRLLKTDKMKQLLLFSFALLGTPLCAQVFMRPFENAGTLALGGATVAYANLSLAANNEALLGKEPALGFVASSAIPYSISGWNTAQIQGVVPIGSNSGLGIDLNHSGAEAYAEQRMRIQYGRRLGQKIYLGAGFDVLRISQSEYGSATAATFGLGALAQVLPEVCIGARVNNPIQQKLNGEQLPTSLRLGASWQASTLFSMLFETEKILDRPVQIKFGAEYLPLNVLAVRIGTRTNPSRISFGLGLRLKNGLRLDAASEWHPVLGTTPALAISWCKKSYTRK